MTGSSDKTKDLSVTALKGVGPKTAEVLERLNIRTLDDLEMNWPRSYEYYERPVRICDCPDEGLVSVSGVITGKPWRGGSGRRTMVSVFIDDGSGRMRLIWFNNPWIISNLKPGTRCVFRGRVYMNGRVKSLTQPVMFSPEDYEQFSGGLLPVYALTSGITNRQMRRLTAQALDSGYAADDFIPQRIMDRYGLRGTSGALRSMHFPKDAEDLAEARKRFVFEEFFLFILGLRSLRSDDAEGSGRGSDGIVLPGSPDTGALIDSLPYTLTDSQETAWSEISEDLASGSRMDRLLQGDVGSGKTVVAALAIVQAAASGKQAVLLAPTTILAEQHYATLTGMFQTAGLDIPAVLLTGSMSAKEKAAAKQAISSGEAKAVIGTHALIQEDVAFADLALAVTDEQHRFGVLQRASLSFKAAVTPHILMMSATPIPRTQAILLFGSRAVSVLEEKPSGRLPVKNTVVDTAYRERAFNFIAKQIGEGRQAYVICPMIEDNDESDAASAVSEAALLKKHFGKKVRVGLLHGRMKASEKEDVMEDFSRGGIDVLVSTTVVEVGVDVPNATVMMVENAERFGLAQLHQLRGRIGRGREQSYCIFIDGSGKSEENRRLKVLLETNDGFRIASEDLKLRGPGELFGVRQSGEMAFALGDVVTDAQILSQASDAVSSVLKEDPRLDDPAHTGLRSRLESYMRFSGVPS